MKLRTYQKRFVDEIANAFQRHDCVLGVLPTGGGKTVCFARMMHEHNGASAAIVHRKEIVGQISLALAREGVRHRIVAPPATVSRIRRRHITTVGRSFVDQRALVGVASVQTLVSKAAAMRKDLAAWIPQLSLVVFDEGHHYVNSGLWSKAVDAVKHAKRLMVTATPERADGKGLGGWADGYAETMIEGPSVRWLIEQGYLSPYKYYAPESDLDLSDLPITASGDVNTQAMRKRIINSHLVGDVVDHYRAFADGRRAIVFANDLETADEIAGRLGDLASALSGKTDQAIRDRDVGRFERGELLQLVNVDLFDEGFDVPAVEVSLLARRTESLAKYLQMVGRALRPVYADGFDLSTAEGRKAAIAAGPKPHAVIIDPVRNWERHGLPDWPRSWSLVGAAGAKRKKRAPALTICLSCTQPYKATLDACPMCGASRPAPAARERPEQVDGALKELDVEALRALLDKARRADMSDEEYQRELIAKRVPAVGRGAALRRHREAKYRRTVLRELMKMWAAARPGMSESERHRTFFRLYGVDVVTAMTLNAKETDALIERIEEGFCNDV